MKTALTAFLLLLAACPAWAGSITGTETGVVNIEITQYLNGPQVGQTFYENIPATLTYSVLPPTVLDEGGIPVLLYPNGSFNFDLATQPYSFDTASALISGPRFYASASSPPLVESGLTFWSLESAIGHRYSLTADMFLSSDNTVISAGYNLNTADTTGTGDVITASFTPVPEPSSIVLFVCGMTALTLFWSRKCSA